MDSIAKESLLFDFYGQLLTEKKRRVMELYHEEDLSLAEIAEESGISRAAVYDSLKSAERKLAEYEQKLGLVDRFSKSNKAFAEIGRSIDDIEKTHSGDAELKNRLDDIRSIIGELEAE
ncbi:YlxM family DNA-binding protein [Aminicella lysinilytica]|mgnify:CR=1 FL=1|uniref:UPF0122 protein EV211_12032 n=1 Tax=Aminicella lysinilytica TaxID=433323 RepID=A0A4R6Q0C8_9FIRM|nr:YlxM family DNA-binding protein [Aminicella lysinilytica]NLD10718.1 YlxM family DNA-binding protein [Clostridiales bacterium]TDP54624.1 hypothetical protein EV211_12032 [Aminicella lysinilytica]